MQDRRKFIVSDESILIRDVPPSVYDHATSLIKTYSVCMIGMNPEKFGLWGRPIGSATLVSGAGRLGLVTAAHVTASDTFRDSVHVGLSIQESTHRFSIERRYLTVNSIGADFASGKGPDLSVIRLPDADAPRILAAMSAWNIDQDPNELVDPQVPGHCFVWCAAGFPQVLQTKENAVGGSDPTWRIEGFIGPTNVTQHYRSENREYLELAVVYNEPPGTVLPQTFKGMSGGGVWNFPLVKELKSGAFMPQDPVLVGVIFWESKDEGTVISLRCHGSDGVYSDAKRLLTTT